MTNRRKALLSAAFCGMWAVVIWYYAGARTDAKDAYREVQAGPAATARHFMDNGVAPRYPGVIRDIFMARDADAKAGNEPLAMPRPDNAGKEDAGIEGMRQRLRFIGYIGKGDERFAFVSDGEEVFAVKKGALAAEGFRVSEISDDALTVEAVEGSGLVLLGLDEGGSPQ
ncbi:MAG: hypothetical protein HY887_01760 [Deltaproteobacteria bacterium]|nr:hypothetical protein [Deltaproteobacteria bacterium]